MLYQNLFTKLVLPGLLFFLPIIVDAQHRGRVVSVADGDTFTLLTADRRQVKVRLHGVDCPEKGQAFGQRAKQFTTELIAGQTVQVTEKSRDRYRRVVGVVWLGDVCVNEALLSNGYAWHYKKYDQNRKWAQLEQRARGQRLGLWADRNAVPPWEFRAAKRSGARR